MQPTPPSPRAPWQQRGSFLIKWHFQGWLLCWPYHSKPHVGSSVQLCGDTQLPKRGAFSHLWASPGWGGVRLQGGLVLTLTLGMGGV